MTRRQILVLVTAGLLSSYAVVVFSSARQAKIFETDGTASIMYSSTFTHGTEKKSIPIPTYIDITKDEMWRGLFTDGGSGWTMCRVPLKSELSFTGIKEKTFVFRCRPLSY